VLEIQEVADSHGVHNNQIYNRVPCFQIMVAGQKNKAIDMIVVDDVMLGVKIIGNVCDLNCIYPQSCCVHESRFL